MKTRMRGLHILIASLFLASCGGNDVAFSGADTDPNRISNSDNSTLEGDEEINPPEGPDGGEGNNDGNDPDQGSTDDTPTPPSSNKASQDETPPLKSLADSKDSVSIVYTVGQTEVKSEKIQFSVDSQMKSFNLTGSTQQIVDSYTQPAASPVENEFVQGSAAGSTMDTFLQDGNQGLLDIVLVVDNSGSMAEEQVNLSTKLSPLINEVSNSDWRIGIISTDERDTCVRRVISKTDADPVNDFESVISSLGILGDGTERGISQSVAAMNCAENQWMRPGSKVAVLIVSDEENCSKGQVFCDGEPGKDYDYLTNDLVAKGKTLGQDARIYGLIWIPGDGTCTSAGSEGEVYNDAINATGGTAGSICDADYTPTLSAISTDVASILKTQFKLSRTPSAGTLSVTVDDVAVPATDYTLTGSTIDFNDGAKPALNSTIKASYSYAASEIKTTFILSEAPHASSLKVYVDGNLVDASEYSHIPGSKAVTFNTAPAENSMVNFVFNKNTIENKFTLTQESAYGVATVKVNGNVTENYSVSGTQLVIYDAPQFEDAVTVEYLNLTSKDLVYELGELLPGAKDFDLKNSKGEAIGFSISGTSLTLEEPGFAYNDEVTLTYNHDSSWLNTVALPVKSVLETLEVSTNVANCELGNGIELNDTQLTVNCEFGASAELNWQVEVSPEVLNEFKLEGVDLSKGTYEVFLNDEKIENFEITGDILKILSELKNGDKVKLVYVVNKVSSY